MSIGNAFSVPPVPRLMPLEAFEKPWNDPSIVQDEKYRAYLGVILNHPVNSIVDFRRISAWITKSLASIRGVRMQGYKDLVYTYRDISASNYFEYPILAVMRGSVLREYENGDVRQVAFPFSKFFNYHEVPETRRLPSEGFIATEKLDGTLIIVWVDPDTGELRFNTRGMLDYHGVTRGKMGYYIRATPGKISNPYVVRFIKAVLRMELWPELESLAKPGRTLMFELVNKKIPASYQYDVLETPEDSPDWIPYFLAYRDHTSFEIVYDDSTAFPTPKRYNVSDVYELLKMIDRMTDKEGVVLHYPGRSYRSELPWWNYMVKLKNKVYVMRAYVESGTVTWRQLASLVLSGRIDDLQPYLNEEQKKFVEEYQKAYESLMDSWLELVETVRRVAEKKGEEKITRILKNNFHAGYVAEAIIRSRSPEGGLKWIVRQYLIGKETPTALVNALRRFQRRIEKIGAELRSLS